MGRSQTINNHMDDDAEKCQLLNIVHANRMGNVVAAARIDGSIPAEIHRLAWLIFQFRPL